MIVPVLSFFTGGGFLDIGFELAAFKIVWTNENNPAFVRMYEKGMSSLRRSQRKKPFMARITNQNSIVDLRAATIRREAFGGEPPGLYGLIGGPPCPDFSNGGKHAGHNGENGKLTKTFVQLIAQLKPSFFVIENVAGLYRFRKHRRFLESQVAFLRKHHGYAVDYDVLDALSLGVPQHRERLFVVGFLRRIAENGIGRKLGSDELNWFSWPTVKRYSDVLSLSWPEQQPYGGKPARPPNIPIELTVYPSLFTNNPEKLPNGRDCFNALSPKFHEREEGNVSGKSFKRLHRFRFSPTVWYGNQEVHLHPSKPRRLSVREALRIQTVPDEYVLPDEESLSAKFKLVANGVPCLMAKRIAEAISSFLTAADVAGRRRS